MSAEQEAFIVAALREAATLAARDGVTLPPGSGFAGYHRA